MATEIGSIKTPDSIAEIQRPPVTTRSFNACVLVVEDHEDTRFMLKTMLEMRGVRVIEAENGEMAVALARNVRLDLILMDGNLPLLDGYQATRRIRELEFACEIPIVLLSGHAQAAAEAKACAAGCNDYLVKPFDGDKWDRLLERHLSQNKLNHRTAKRASRNLDFGQDKPSEDVESNLRQFLGPAVDPAGRGEDQGQV